MFLILFCLTDCLDYENIFLILDSLINFFCEVDSLTSSHEQRLFGFWCVRCLLYIGSFLFYGV
jgi:hypothetical protein